MLQICDTFAAIIKRIILRIVVEAKLRQRKKGDIFEKGELVR